MSATLPPPPADSNLVAPDGKTSPPWSRWLQQLFDTLRPEQTWTPLTFATNWRTWSDASYADGEYCKDALGFVRLRGLVECTNAASTLITTLPAGYRPPSGKGGIFACAHNGNGLMNVLVKPDGTLTVVAAATTGTWLSLDTICFATT